MADYLGTRSSSKKSQVNNTEKYFGVVCREPPGLISVSAVSKRQVFRRNGGGVDNQ